MSVGNGDADARKAGACVESIKGKEGPLSDRDWRNVVAFGFLGLLNNTSYIVMIAGATEIASGGVALVYICSEVTELLLVLSLPYWAHLMGYRLRIILAGGCTMLSYTLVAFGRSLSIQLLGVAFSGVQFGLGQASMLGLAAKYNPHTSAMLTAWSSGTGFAGIFGYAWLVFFHDTLGLTFRVSLMLGNSLVLSYFLTYFVLLTPPPPPRDPLEPFVPTAPETATERISAISRDHSDRLVVHMTVSERFRFVLSLWQFTVPLFFVYFSQYAMQSGAWAVIGFPLNDEGARAKFYEYANWTYQAGTFVSRSSGMWLRANVAVFWAMSLLQAVFLVFFVTDAVWLYWWDWALLGPCFCTGLLGGAVYVNAFTLIARKFRAGPMLELALTAACVGNSFGIFTSAVSGLFIQACLFRLHEIPGAKVSC